MSKAFEYTPSITAPGVEMERKKDGEFKESQLYIAKHLQRKRNDEENEREGEGMGDRGNQG